MAAATLVRNIVESIGAITLGGIRYAGGMSLLFGAVVRSVWEGIFTPKVRPKRKALAQQIVRLGVRSIGIVVLVQLFIGVILTLQMTPPLEPWGQVDKVANIIGVGGSACSAR